MNIDVRKPTDDELTALNVRTWPIWEKEISAFDWHYDETEKCYFLRGEADVHFGEGKTVRVGEGDLVIFPKGLKCRWEIKKAVKKHYCFV